MESAIIFMYIKRNGFFNFDNLKQNFPNDNLLVIIH